MPFLGGGAPVPAAGRSRVWWRVAGLGVAGLGVAGRGGVVRRMAEVLFSKGAVY